MSGLRAEIREAIQGRVNDRQREFRGLNTDVPASVWSDREVCAALDQAVDYAEDAFGVEALDFDDSELEEEIEKIQEELNWFTSATYTDTRRIAARSKWSGASGSVREQTKEISIKDIPSELRNSVYQASVSERGFLTMLAQVPSEFKADIATLITTQKEILKTKIPDAVRNSVARMHRPAAPSAALIGRYLNRDEGVKQFRREVLHDDLFDTSLSGREAAWGFITSPLIKLLSVEDFDEIGTCPMSTTGHLSPDPEYADRDGILGQASIIGYRDGDESDLVLEYEIEGNGWQKTVAHELKTYAAIGGNVFGMPRPLTPHVIKLTPRPKTLRPIVPDWLLFRGGKPRIVDGFGRTVAGQAMDLVERLLHQFPVTVWALLEFLLTDRLPSPRPIEHEQLYCQPTIQVDGEGRSARTFEAIGPTTLFVQPWVEPDHLAKMWSDIRGSKVALGREARTPDQEHLDMFLFALRNTAPDDEFRWQELASAWAKEHPGFGGKTPRSTFRNTFLRTREVLFPGFMDAREAARAKRKDK